jgi:hypothetical protein
VSGPPSAWTLQTVISIAQATLARLEADGTLDTDDAALLSQLRDEGADVETLLVRLLRAIGEAQANAASTDARISALGVRRSRFQRQHDSYRAATFAIMDALGLTKWKHAEFSASIIPGHPGVVITDEAALPEQFVRITRAPDKAALKEALSQGEVIPGAELSNGLPTLTLRTK